MTAEGWRGHRTEAHEILGQRVDLDSTQAVAALAAQTHALLALVDLAATAVDHLAHPGRLVQPTGEALESDELRALRERFLAHYRPGVPVPAVTDQQPEGVPEATPGVSEDSESHSDGTDGYQETERQREAREYNARLHGRLKGGIETDAELLAWVGTDAAKWADEFVRTFEGHMVLGRHLQSRGVDAVDGGTMLGWFANAIEVGRVAGHATRFDDLVRLVDGYMCDSIKRGNDCDGHDGMWNMGRCEVAYRVRERIRGLLGEVKPE